MNKIIILIFALIIFGCGSKKGNNSTTIDLIKTQIQTPSVMCNICVNTIKNTLEKIEGVKNVVIDLNNKITTVEYTKSLITVDNLVFAITEAGYDANNKTRNLEAYEKLPTCCKDGKY